MRNSYIVLFLIFVFLGCTKKQSSYYLSFKYYSNGMLREVSYLDTIGTGIGYNYLFTFQGEKVTEQEYLGKIPHGKCMGFEKGRLIHLSFVKNGKYEGKSITYNLDGTILNEGHYKNDKEFGIWNYYDKNKLLLSEYYINGKKSKDLYVDSLLVLRRLENVPPPPQ